MDRKYALTKLMSSWAVVMSANSHIMEHFETKGAAVEAMWEYERGEREQPEKPDVWVIDDHAVIEPDLGEQVGEVTLLDMNQYNIVRRLTLSEFDDLMEEYCQEHGNYPDQ